ncbi:MAG: GAG-pre-integrase domain-containing protein, partial [bacterium]
TVTMYFMFYLECYKQRDYLGIPHKKKVENDPPIARKKKPPDIRSLRRLHRTPITARIMNFLTFTSCIIACGGRLFSSKALKRKESSEPAPAAHRIFETEDFFHLHTNKQQIQRYILHTEVAVDRSDELNQTELSELRTLLQQMPQTLSSEAGFPVIFDTGSTKTVSPNKLDFLGDIRAPPIKTVLKGISKGLPVEGIGTVQWNFIDDDGKACHIRTEAYYVPEISLRLFSPQSALQWNQYTNGSYNIKANDSVFNWDDHRMTIRYHPLSNLPITSGFHDQSVSQLASSLHTCVTDDINQNLKTNQKMLLKWHFRLGHIGFESLQWLAMRGFLPKTIAKCDRPNCASCEFGTAGRRKVGKESRTMYPKK